MIHLCQDEMVWPDLGPENLLVINQSGFLKMGPS